MQSVLTVYFIAVRGFKTALLYLAIIAAVVALVDWAVRTRRVSPFSGVSRFFRARVDPVMAPVERMVLRAGGLPSSAPWWMLVAVIVGGLVLIALLDFVGGLLSELALGASSASNLFVVALSWAFELLEVALLVRVVSSWFTLSPYSPWVRWAYILTDWLIRPLRRIVPPFGMLDLTPLVAYFALWLLRPIVVGAFARLVGLG